MLPRLRAPPGRSARRPRHALRSVRRRRDPGRSRRDRRRARRRLAVAQPDHRRERRCAVACRAAAGESIDEGLAELAENIVADDDTGVGDSPRLGVRVTEPRAGGVGRPTGARAATAGGPRAVSPASGGRWTCSRPTRSGPGSVCARPGPRFEVRRQPRSAGRPVDAVGEPAGRPRQEFGRRAAGVGGRRRERRTPHRSHPHAVADPAHEWVEATLGVFDAEAA